MMKNVFFQKNSKVKEIIYFTGFFFFIVFQLLRNVNYTFPSLGLSLLKYASILFAGFAFLQTLPKYSQLWTFFILLVLLLTGIVIFNTIGFTNQLIMTPLLVFGAKGIDFQRILNFSFIVNIVFCVTIICLSLIGVLDNTIDDLAVRDFLSIAKERKTYGYIWPTNLANHIFYIVLMYWLLKKGNFNIIHIIGCIVISYVIIVNTDARLGAMCIVLIVATTIILKIVNFNFIEKFPLISRILSFFVPIAAFFTFYLTKKYDASNTVMLELDILLSGRLHISQAMINDGISLFGKKVIMYGGANDTDLYNYVDSAYLQMLVIFGIVYSLLLLLAYTYIGIKAYHEKNDILLFTVVISGLSAVIAQHFIELSMNPLLLCLWQKMNHCKDKK